MSLEPGEENVGESRNRNMLKYQDVRQNSIKRQIGSGKNFPVPGEVFSRAASSDMVQMSEAGNQNDKSHSDDEDDAPRCIETERDRPIIDPEHIEMSLCRDDEYSPRLPDKNEKALFKKKPFI